MIAMTVDDMRTGSAKAAALMGALSHEGRLLIMCALCEKEHGVSELLRITGLGQSALIVGPLGAQHAPAAYL